MQKIFDPTEAAGFCSDALDQPPRALINALFRHRRTRRAGQQRLCDSFIGWCIGHAEQMFRTVSHNEALQRLDRWHTTSPHAEGLGRILTLPPAKSTDRVRVAMIAMNMQSSCDLGLRFAR